MKNKGLMTFGTLGAIFLGFIAPLVAWLNKEKLTSEEKAVTANLFNFEISLLVIGIIIMFIPAVGQIANLVLEFVNIVVAIMAFMAARDNKRFKALTIYEFVK